MILKKLGLITYRRSAERKRITNPPMDWKILLYASPTSPPWVVIIWKPEMTMFNTAIIPTMLAAHLYMIPM